MLTREQIVGIISGFDTPSLIEMLAVKGIKVDGGDSLGDQPGEEDGLESWNALKVPVGQDNRPPLTSKENYMEVKQQTPNVSRGERMDLSDSSVIEDFANDEPDDGSY